MKVFWCIGVIGLFCFSWHRSMAILDGEVVTSGARFVGQLRYRGKTICTVAAVKDDYIVCAAHCHDDKMDDEIRIKLGSYFRGEGLTFSINQTFIMPDRIFDENDLMLIKLNSKIPSNFPIAYVRISSTPPMKQKDYIVAGFGRTTTGYPSRLLKTNVHFITNETCKKFFYLYDTNVCTANSGKALMDGDSGAITFKTGSDGHAYAFALHNRSGLDIKSPYVEMDLSHPDSISFFASHGIAAYPYPGDE